MTDARSALEEARVGCRWRPYPEYRDSGVEWLGEIPAQWDVRRLKHAATIDDEALSESTNPGLQLLYVDIGSVDATNGIQRKERMTFADAPSRARRRVREGDVIVSTVRTYLRAIAPIVDPEPNLVVSTGFAVVRPMEDLDGRYAAYALRAPHFVDAVVANSEGVSYPAVSPSKLSGLAIALPSLSEQRAIAAFLDRETARIDALIAKKERQIELLEEKRAALISHAVTKGLDPNVPMKDSGVEWLGEIPAHWEVKRLRHISPSLSVGVVVTPSQYIDDVGDVPFLYGSDIRERQILADQARRITRESNCLLAKSMLRARDLVTVRVGYPGATAVIPPSLDGCNCASIMIVRRSPRFHSPWLCYAMNSPPGRFNIELVEYGAAQTQFNIGHAVDFLYPVPPLEEQVALAAQLEAITTNIAALSTRIGRSIEQLREYRSALISAAVRGKIDVRGETS